MCGNTKSIQNLGCKGMKVHVILLPHPRKPPYPHDELCIA